MTPNPPRIVFFGMRCRFSALVLETLVARGGSVAGIVLAGEPGEAWAGDLPLATRYAGPGTIETIAKTAGIPVRIAAANVMDDLRRWRPDVIAVACFPKRLPPEAIALPRLGALNVHPSLLPRHRGPEPLFWTFSGGDRETGATVHVMTDRFDAGPIVAQTVVDLPFGQDGALLEARLAGIGGDLLAGAIARRNAGDFSVTPQDEDRATAEGFPIDEDLIVDTNRSGRWALSFVRGTVPLGFTPTIVVAATGQRIAVDQAHSYAAGGRLESPFIRNKETIHIQFLDGICEFSVKELRKTILPAIDTTIVRVR